MAQLLSRDPRTVVVTGASGGVGRATARAFAARGDRVAPLARGREGRAAAADGVREAGGTALVVPVEVSGAKAVDDAAQQVAGTFGTIDVWSTAPSPACSPSSRTSKPTSTAGSPK